MYMCYVCMYIYIYIYIHTYIATCHGATRSWLALWRGVSCDTPNPPTNIVDFRGLDSSIILI